MENGISVFGWGGTGWGAAADIVASAEVYANAPGVTLYLSPCLTGTVAELRRGLWTASY